MVDRINKTFCDLFLKPILIFSFEFDSGVFKGTYGPHGIELIHLSYKKSDVDENGLVRRFENRLLY